MAKSTTRKDTASFRQEAEQAALEERTIQRRIDRSDEKAKGKRKKEDGGAMQAGARLSGASLAEPASQEAGQRG